MINAKPDILITDFHALSSMSLDPLFKHKIGILFLWTGCLPRLEDENLLGFISQGVIGILSTEASPSELRKAIKSVASGELWFNRKKLKDILSCVKNVAGEIHQLTGKERDVIKMICKGYRNKEIMKSLNMTEQSVKKHLNSIYKKAGITDRLQLALYAIRHWSSSI
ncbi:MAG: response regulator transcription factor [Candidatus Brocadia sinica]|nr:response regulator transcription factor [Candidatus Brocadia sinica]